MPDIFREESPKRIFLQKDQGCNLRDVHYNQSVSTVSQNPPSQYEWNPQCLSALLKSSINYGKNVSDTKTEILTEVVINK